MLFYVLYAHRRQTTRRASWAPAASHHPDDAEPSQTDAIDRLLSRPYPEPRNAEDPLLPTENLMKVSIVGVPWYRKGDYARLRTLFADGARLHETYAEWSAAARATEAHLVAQGHRVVRVEIEPEQFAAWCYAGNVAVDAEARMRYANEFAYLDKRFGDAQEEVYRRAQETTGVVERHVTAVFTYRPDGRLDFEGSGLFARLDARHYLVTAAHVLDACEQGCVVRAAEATGQELSGTRVVTGRPTGKTRDDDVFDIGFVRLSGSEVAGIGGDNFLDLTHTVDGPPAEPVEAMIALGFAARDQAVEGRMVRTKLTMFMTGAESAHAYRLARTNPRSHLLVSYRRKEIVFNGQHHGSAPSLKGMSGGGLWQVSLSGENQPAQPPALAAIIIEQPQSYRTAILATRAPLIRSFIRRFDTHA